MSRRPTSSARLRGRGGGGGPDVLTIRCDDQHRPLALAWLSVSGGEGSWRGEVHPQAFGGGAATVVAYQPGRGAVGFWLAERGPLDVRCHRCGFHLRVRGEELHGLAGALAELGSMPAEVSPRMVAGYVRRGRG